MKPTDQNSYYGIVEDDSAGNDIGDFELRYGKAYGLKVDTVIGAVNASAGYTVFKDGTDAWYDYETGLPNDILDQKDNKIWNVGASFDVAKDLVFTADYLKSNMDRVYYKQYNPIIFDGDDGYVFGLNYKGAKASEPGTYDIYANYYNQAEVL